jgi:hypothetical protein
MSKFSKWAYVVAVFAGGSLFHLGCSFGGQTGLLLAILQEDIFG